MDNLHFKFGENFDLEILATTRFIHSVIYLSFDRLLAFLFILLLVYFHYPVLLLPHSLSHQFSQPKTSIYLPQSFNVNRIYIKIETNFTGKLVYSQFTFDIIVILHNLIIFFFIMFNSTRLNVARFNVLKDKNENCSVNLPVFVADDCPLPLYWRYDALVDERQWVKAMGPDWSAVVVIDFEVYYNY